MGTYPAYLQSLVLILPLLATFVTWMPPTCSYSYLFSFSSLVMTLLTHSLAMPSQVTYMPLLATLLLYTPIQNQGKQILIMSGLVDL